jgi:rhodanese-related sulfurtransferase
MFCQAERINKGVKMKMLRVIIIMSVITSVYLLFARDYFEFQNTYRDVSAQQAKKLISRYNDLKIIDISGTYDMGHIPGAENYFIGDGTLQSILKDLDKNDRYLIYYHTNKTSIKAAEMFTGAGFKKVYRLDGNFSSWVQAGFETNSI